VAQRIHSVAEMFYWVAERIHPVAERFY